jgi:hypothetical protein
VWPPSATTRSAGPPPVRGQRDCPWGDGEIVKALMSGRSTGVSAGDEENQLASLSTRPSSLTA